MIFPSGSVTPVSTTVSSNVSTVFQRNILKSFDIYGFKIQNLKVGSVLTYYPVDSRISYCKVCNEVFKS